jgi:hypothetical protein
VGGHVTSLVELKKGPDSRGYVVDIGVGAPGIDGTVAEIAVVVIGAETVSRRKRNGIATCGIAALVLALLSNCSIASLPRPVT